MGEGILSPTRILKRKVETQLRDFEIEDLESVVEILRMNMKEYVIRHYGEWKEDPLRFSIRISSKHIRLLEKKREIIGFYWVEPRKDFLELLEIHVAPPHQRKGLGREMMKEVEQWAQENGFEEIRLWVFQENPAVSFYERLGYRVLSEDFLRSRLRMVKNLSLIGQ